MQTQQWFNNRLPQTLQIAVILFYIDAFFMLIGGAFSSPTGILFLAGSAGAGYLISNEKKPGYYLAIAIAAFGLWLYVGVLASGTTIFDLIFSQSALGLLFAIAKMALLVHPESRKYERLWFK